MELRITILRKDEKYKYFTFLKKFDIKSSIILIFKVITRYVFK
jgi:hypothetical protein